MHVTIPSKPEAACYPSLRHPRGWTATPLKTSSIGPWIVLCTSCGLVFHSSPKKMDKQAANRPYRLARFCCVLLVALHDGWRGRRTGERHRRCHKCSWCRWCFCSAWQQTMFSSAIMPAPLRINWLLIGKVCGFTYLLSFTSSPFIWHAIMR